MAAVMTSPYEDAAFAQSPSLKSLVVSQSQFFDSIALDLGCFPRLADYVFDPVLVYKLWTGPFLPQIYRLRGPHATPAAARAYVKATPVYCMRNETPTQVGSAKFPFIVTMMAWSNFWHEVFQREVLFPLVYRAQPDFADVDKKHLYGFDPSKVAVFKP